MGALARAAPLQMCLGAHVLADGLWSGDREREFSLSYNFFFMGKWPSAVPFQALEKCLIAFLGGPLTGQITAKGISHHVSGRGSTGGPGMALSWISFYTTLVSRSQGKKKNADIFQKGLEAPRNCQNFPGLSINTVVLCTMKL